MPTPYIEKLSKEGKGSVESLEKKWDEAKSKAKEEGKADNYAYITSIFQNMIHAGTLPMKINAATRLLMSNQILAANRTEAGKAVISLSKTFGKFKDTQEHDKNESVIWQKKIGSVDARVVLTWAYQENLFDLNIELRSKSDRRVDMNSAGESLGDLRSDLKLVCKDEIESLKDEARDLSDSKRDVDEINALINVIKSIKV